MKNVIPVDVSHSMLNISENYTVSTRDFEEERAGSLSGLNVGIITMDKTPPHDGEVHYGGDEIIHLISGVLIVESDSNPTANLKLLAGDSCVIKKGEWHKINVIEPAKLVYITPAKNNEHRAK